MRKIHFLMGIIFLSTILVSCSNDDNFKQEVEKKTTINKEEKLKIQQVMCTENKTNSYSVEKVKGDKDLSKGDRKE